MCLARFNYLCGDGHGAYLTQPRGEVPEDGGRLLKKRAPNDYDGTTCRSSNSDWWLPTRMDLRTWWEEKQGGTEAIAGATPTKLYSSYLATIKLCQLPLYLTFSRTTPLYAHLRSQQSPLICSRVCRASILNYFLKRRLPLFLPAIFDTPLYIT